MNFRSIRTFLSARACVLLLLVALAAPAQDAGFGTPPVNLPQDTGGVALRQMLRRLQTTARLMETTAHPDDEDGPMLTLESRGKGVTALSLTLTRGEGGQNRTGSNLFDLLGILRTLEVVASDQYYGVEQRFTRVADFGFSKTAEETLQKWQGGEPALEDMVRVIRQFRPDVIVSRFQGTPRDGHGQHQASGILTRQAFRVAADPDKFPEQIREGLQPWQAKKLYVGMFRRAENEDYTVALDTGVEDPLVGTSYTQFALQGLKHQESQGVGNWTVPRGPRLTYYKLADSVLPAPPTGTHEKDFFDGIDTSLSGLASRLGDEEHKVPFLRPALVQMQKKITEATVAAEASNSPAAAVPLLQTLQLVESAMSKLQSALPATAAKDEMLRALREKQMQLRRASSLALGFEVEVTAVSGSLRSVDRPLMAVPGHEIPVSLTLSNHGPQPITLKTIELAGGTLKPLRGGLRLPITLQPGKEAVSEWTVAVPQDTPYTRPYEHRPDPERDAVYTLDQPQYATLAFPPTPFHLSVSASSAACTPCGSTAATVPVTVKYNNAAGATVEYPLAVGPEMSVQAEPDAWTVTVGRDRASEVTVRVYSAVPETADVSIGFDTPAGWRTQPTASLVDATDPTGTYKVVPGELHEGHYQLRAVVDSRGKKFTEGYTVVSRPDLGEFFYYRPAMQRITAVNLNLPAGLRVGYIMGAGDDIPAVLQQAGMNVHVLTPDELTKGDLSQYGTIVVGIRAYDVRDDVRANNQRLLDFVNNGGTLVVQYNANTGEFNSGHYTPYPADLSRDRVTVEEAPVDLLAPEDSVFHFPNQITARDFDGWVQERGLYFMSNWDQHFEPLLACHDPGEQPMKGGLLRARYGKGTYLYTGYAFFRQLPAGVPGAVRLFVNLVSAGHER